jgi:maltose alpha-D-glucosyltransferase/alpha-amylase
MNFHFPLMPRMFMSVQTESRMPIIDILEQTPEPPGTGQWATFLRNHDELTLEMVTDEERDLMLRAYARDSEMRINLGIRRRLAPLLGNDRRKIELLNALLFSLPGTPVLYYGDEIGMGDNVYLGDRDGVRTPMQWSADRNAGFSSCNPHRLFLPLIAEQGYHYETVNVESQQHSSTSLLSFMRQIIALRRRHRVLGRGSIEFLDPDNPQVLAFVRTLEDESPFLCVANLSRLAQHVELDLRRFIGEVPVEVFGRNRFSVVTEAPHHVTLAPYGFFWFVMEPSGLGPATAPGPEADGAISELAVPYLAGDWAEVLRRRAPLTRAISTWLPRRRWFAAKDKRVREITIDDMVPLRSSGAEVALLILRASFNEGEDQRYALPVLHARPGTISSIEQMHPGSVIARLDDGGLLVDAMVLPEGAHAVATSALTRRSHRGRHGVVRGMPRRTGLTKAAGTPREVHVISVEQSNSSAILNGQLIAKLVRRIEPSENPDVELPAHLIARGFEHVPGVAATLEVDLRGETEPASVVVVHDAVANEGDLWQWMVSELSRELEQHMAEEGEPADLSESPTMTMGGLLGRRTAQLHEALARTEGGATEMAPQAFTLLWQRSLLQTLRSGLRSTQRVLRRWSNDPSISGVAMADADAEGVATLLGAPDELLGRFERLRAGKLEAQRIRVHGDLHLGQVLWTGHDVVFIDFEGEPGRPMGERIIKRSPLVDLAGMVRSLDYAGREAVDLAIERGLVAEHDMDRVDRWRARWTQTISNEMVEAYFAEIEPAGLVPADAADARLLLDLYTVEKGLYEIRYEIANRPSWVGRPLAAVVDMLMPVGVS